MRNVRLYLPCAFLIFCLHGAGNVFARSGNVSGAEKESPELPVMAADAPQIRATVHLDREGEAIHPFTYGLFTELLSSMYENGVWSEMLSDRKFFYPVSNSDKLEPRNTRGHQLRWRPIGEESTIVMDKEEPYVGKQSVRVLAGEGRRGIRQGGLQIAGGRGYDGRVVLKGDNGTIVKVSLVWGSGKEQRTSVEISPVSGDYRKYRFHFDAPEDSKDAALEIEGDGGSFTVGAVSLMPDDNVKGFRRDIVDILKNVGGTIYRWPGGNFLANYDWRNGIGDSDQRPPRYDYAWNTVESNDVGTDEFLALCNMIGAEPYLVVNIGMGDAHSAGEMVEYVNGAADTPMGTLRARNGHPEPYGVKYWGVGNEMYGEWQIGYMSSWHYSLKHNFFAEEMLAKDPDIKLVACGATIYERGTTSRHHRKPLQYTLPIEYLSQDDWDGTLYKNCIDNIDFVSEHIYTYYNGHFDAATQSWIKDNDNMTEHIRRTPNRIKGMVEAQQEYESRLPAVKEKHPKFWVDEWIGAEVVEWNRGSTFKTTIGTAAAYHEFFRQSHWVMMGAYTGFSFLYIYDDLDATISSTGQLLKLYREHHGNIPLEVSGNSPQKPLPGTVGVDVPKEVSGSPTWPLDIMATKDGESGKISVSIVNPTAEEMEFTLDFAGGKVGGKADVYSMSADVNDENKVDDPERIPLNVDSVRFRPSVKVKANSVTLIELYEQK